jgi:hypothetical protein
MSALWFWEIPAKETMFTPAKGERDNDIAYLWEYVEGEWRFASMIVSSDLPNYPLPTTIVRVMEDGPLDGLFDTDRHGFTTWSVYDNPLNNWHL